MAALPPFAIGKHVTAVTITPQTVSAAGVLADTTPVRSFVAQWKEIDAVSEFETEMIQSSDQIRDNDVPVGLRTTYTFTGFMLQNDAASPNQTNLLRDAAFNTLATGYHKITLAAAGRTFTFYCFMRRYEEHWRRGECNCNGEFVMVDPGIANPALV